MGKATGFMDYQREKPKDRNPLTRLSDWREYTAPFSDEKLSTQGARCMDCATPFCHMGMELNRVTTGCPIHNLIPEWNDLVYRADGKKHWTVCRKRIIFLNSQGALALPHVKGPVR